MAPAFRNLNTIPFARSDWKPKSEFWFSLLLADPSLTPLRGFQGSSSGEEEARDQYKETTMN
jgi:hypothetical protein